jgi:hypothetical protein
MRDRLSFSSQIYQSWIVFKIEQLAGNRFFYTVPVWTLVDITNLKKSWIHV